MFTAQAVRQFDGDAADFADLYPHQFQVATGPALTPPGWLRTSLDGVTVDSAPDLRRTLLLDADGRSCGVVLGLAVDASGAMLEREAALPPGGVEAAQGWIESLAGRHVTVLSLDGKRRLYVDPVGDQSTVYNPTLRVAASTTLFAMEGNFQDNPVFPFGRIKTGELSYSLGHTRHRHTRRLFANHYLDLDSFAPVRHWPRPDTDLATRQDEAAVGTIMDEITARLGMVFGEILRRETCMVPLSGGRDSRCLIATALDDLPRARTLFAWRFHRMSSRDAAIGKQIAESLGLPFTIYDNKRLTRDIRMRYLKRNGFALFSTALRSLAVTESLPGGMVMPRGNIMEVLRATNWQRQKEGVLNTAHAIKRLRIGPLGTEGNELRKTVEKDFEDWHRTLPENGQRKVYDLLLLEIVLTHGQGARNYGMPNNFIVNPFNDRRLLQLSMQLPLSLRLTDRAYDMILDRTAPQLKDFAYN